MAESLISLAQGRRTIYQLGKSSSVPDAKIEELVNEAILHVPSAFNTQSTRLVLLLHDQHDRLWDIAIEAFEGLVASGKIPKEIWEKQTLPKLNGFKGAYGTVRGQYFSFSIVADKNRFFSSRILRIFNPCRRSSRPTRINSCLGLSTPMLCISTSVSNVSVILVILLTCAVWTGLEALGFGANLQHYNPLIDAGVAKQWDLPSDWRLIAQLVFGAPEAQAGEKVQKPAEERVKVFGRL